MINIRLRLKIIEYFGNQSIFAKKLNIQDSVVSLVVRGRYNLTVDEQLSWAKELDCKKENIFPAISSEVR